MVVVLSWSGSASRAPRQTILTYPRRSPISAPGGRHEANRGDHHHCNNQQRRPRGTVVVLAPLLSCCEPETAVRNLRSLQ
jgi:hypothetical protein